VSRVGCAIYIPKRDMRLKFRLNDSISSYMTEVLAIDRVVDMWNSGNWQEMNICCDSLSFLQSLDRSSTSLFPATLGKLNQTAADLVYRICKINRGGTKIRFTWCPAHIGIEYNETADVLAKEAALGGTPYNNNITIRELSSSLRKEYDKIDKKFIFEENKALVGKYYINYFPDIKFKFVRSISKKKKDFKNLNRLVTGYSYTKLFLYKMNLVDSPNCACDTDIQDINHIFWACPLLINDRKAMCKILRKLELQDPFSIEYLLGNLNGKIAAIISNYIEKANCILKLSL